MQERKKTEMSNKKNNYTVGTYNSGGESNKPNHTNSSRGGTSSSVLNGGPRQSVHVGAPILRLRVHSSDGKKFLVFFEQTMPYNELAAKIQERYMDVYGNTIEVESIKHIDDRGDEYDLPRTMGLQAAQILRDGELIKVDCQRRILHYNDSRKTPAMLSTPNLFSNNNNFTLNGATNTIMHPDISSIAIDTTNNFLAGTNTNTITSIPTPAPANKHRSSTNNNNNNKAKRPHEQEDKTVFYGEDSLRHQAKSQPLAKKPRMTGTTIPANSVTATSTTTRTTAPTVVANNNETNGDTSTILPGNTDSFIVSPIPNKTTDRTHNISLREELREALGKPDYSSSQDEDDDENEEEERHPKQATTSGEQEQEEEVESQQQQQQQQQAQPMEEETATVHSNPSPAIAPTKAPTEIVDLSEVDDDAEETTMDNSEAVDDSKRMLDEEDDDDENQIFIIDGEDENGTTKEKKRIEEMKKIDNAAVLQPSTTNASQHSDIDSDIDSNTDSDSDTDDESDAKSDSDASSISTILDDEDEDKEEKEGEESNEDKDDESEATTAKIDKEGTSDNENDSENDEEAEDDDEDKGEKNKKKEQPKTSVKSSSTESDSDNDDSDSSDEEDEDEEEDEKEKAKPAPTIKATTTTTTTTKTVPPINNKPTAAAAIARPPMVTPVKVPQPTSTVKSTTTTTTGTNKATGIGFFLGAKGKTNTKSSAPASTTTTPNSAATTTAAITPASPKNPSEFEFHYAAKTKLLDMARKTNTFSGPATTLRRPGLGGVPGQSRTTPPSSSSSSQSSTTTTPTTTSSTTTTT